MQRLLAWITVTGLLVMPLAVAAGPDATREGAKAPVASTQARAQLGVLVMNLTSELRQHYGTAPDRGVLVGRVEPGMAAAVAGVQVGDVIVEVDRHAIAEPDDVVSALAPRRVGDRVDVVVIRQGRSLTVSATLTEEKLTPAKILQSIRIWPFGQWMRQHPGGDDQRCDA
jgi:C-terminal processing protease CtpA/Prc